MTVVVDLDSTPLDYDLITPPTCPLLPVQPFSSCSVSPLLCPRCPAAHSLLLSPLSAHALAIAALGRMPYPQFSHL
jgi:hypothetical protein